MASFMDLLNGGAGGEWEDSQYASPPEEQIIAGHQLVEATPVVTQKAKRGGNFSEKEDLLLVSAWLEISQDAVQGIDQNRSTYWKRIHDHYHAHRNFDSDRNVSSLSHRWALIQEGVNKFCGWYAQIQNRRQSGVTEQDKVQQACAIYKEKDPKKRSFPFLHCWNVVQHAPKWNDAISHKKQKTSSNASPSSCTPGINESHHGDEEDGVTHSSPMKGRPDGRKKEKARRYKNTISQGDTLCMEAMENHWSRREKIDELKEMKKKERNDERLALETRRLELKQEVKNKKIEAYKQVENRKLDIQEKELQLKQSMEDERVMNMDLSGLSER
ncbi:glutathione S-transferase T3-like [Phragmites australis]|uniref:glutathione S-transferase T3-like n=1 Tax=Phragmites australis TaxID=29695 RepID=UPI002D77B2F2|nr:glutathione S-transferase T3-like [Phragmites australis]